VVWLVRDTRDKGQVWALKELDFNGIVSRVERDEAMEMFEREAAILVRLEHPALPRVIDRFREGGCEFLVMERVEGPTLDQIARRGPQPESVVAGWATQICDVLEYLHGCCPPVVYRDLKPANVMLAVDGRIRLIDFGIARPLNPTRPGDTVAYGTPGYAPPEQYAGFAVPASDVYALGVTMYQLLTCRNPQDATFRLASARIHNADASAEMDALIEACTRAEAEARPPVGEVRERLARLPVAERGRPRWWSTLARLLGK
jgi:serine/threonine-protein kinase